MSDRPVNADGALDAAAHEHPSYLRHHFESVEQQADATNFAMWLFLLTEVMFFGGLFTAYLIYRNWYYPSFVAASHQLSIPLGGFNTLLLITSSFTMAMGVWCAETRRKSGLVLCLVLTFILGLGLGSTVIVAPWWRRWNPSALTAVASPFEVPARPLNCHLFDVPVPVQSHT